MSLVIFGSSNIISDIFDAAWSVGIKTSTIVLHQPSVDEPRSVPLEERVQAMAAFGGIPKIIKFDDFHPAKDDLYILGPTTPTRRVLAQDIKQRWGLRFFTLIHKTAYVSPLALLGEGVFVGANSVVAPGAVLSPHVFVNRGVTIGHDTKIGSFSRVQPGASLGGLSTIGEGVTVGLGATLLERLCVGHDAVIAGGAVVLSDVPDAVMVAGVPSTIRKQLTPAGV